MAKLLVNGGWAQQCLKAYRDVRGQQLENGLRKLRVERLGQDDVARMQWEELEGRIGSWIKHVRIVIMVVLKVEKKLCDSIFDGMDSSGERVFGELADTVSHTLFSFGEAVSKSKKSPEKLFVLLDMYETLRDLIPEVETSLASVHTKAKALLQRLALTATETLSEFEDAVEHDSSKQSMADGTVHPLTSYVINYIKYLFEYQATLQELFGDEKMEGGKPKLTVITTRILAVLQTNLELKAKLYRDAALTQLFLMNNVHYMVRTIRKGDLKELLGDDWVQRHRRIVQQHATSYQRAAWNKVFTCLTAQGLIPPGEQTVNRQLLKERFKNFNTAFEELHVRQCLWNIPDNELRSAVQLQVAEVLLPAYRSFLNRYSGQLETGSRSKEQSKYIKYTPEDLDRLLMEFFEGKPGRTLQHQSSGGSSSR
eukprot:TRINITY_DN1738_c0_g1_i1.p1 TRINITY_DN1738_c0_g1~~TRINITY_DN1738_c0_g1_i1.p1  ORF type:complete len:439 (-),score=139.94 TRINITY_DN1738_c0_g1_i1:221-1495(-)